MLAFIETELSSGVVAIGDCENFSFFFGQAFKITKDTHTPCRYKNMQQLELNFPGLKGNLFNSINLLV